MKCTRALVGVAVSTLLVGCGSGGQGSGSTRNGTPEAQPRVGPTLADAPNPLWIAHRGGMGAYPESSWVAYRAAAESGFALEVDLRALNDGTIAVMHDPTVDRTTDGHGAVDSFTTAGWARLHIDRGGGAPPTWNAFLDEYAGQNIIVAEIKASAARQALIDAVVERGIQDHVIAQSFRPADVEATAAAGIPSMLLVDRTTPKVPAGVEYVGCSAAVGVLAACMAAAKAQARHVAVWTVDSRAMAEKVIAAGAVAVFTNQPWLLTGVRSSSPSSGPS